VRATHLVPLDLHAVVVAVVRLIRAHPDCRPDAAISIEGGRTILDGDEDLLHRVIANLMLNAVQAARGPIRITVSVGAVQGGDIPHGTNMDHAVRLQVRDDGPGIPAEIRERLFDPFVSGRPGGSGLGLAIVQRAVQAHRGLVLVESGAGAGTTFTIFLPAKMMAEDAA
jgi:two-component system, NtrC family, sensor histidine kinase PilS